MGFDVYYLAAHYATQEGTGMELREFQPVITGKWEALLNNDVLGSSIANMGSDSGECFVFLLQYFFLQSHYRVKFVLYKNLRH